MEHVESVSVFTFDSDILNTTVILIGVVPVDEAHRAVK
jgi:hypothetical protein